MAVSPNSCAACSMPIGGLTTSDAMPAGATPATCLTSRPPAAPEDHSNTRKIGCDGWSFWVPRLVRYFWSWPACYRGTCTHVSYTCNVYVATCMNACGGRRASVTHYTLTEECVCRCCEGGALFVCRCSVPEGRGSLVICPRRRREGGSPHATTGGSQSTGELTTKGEPPISHTRGRDPAGSLSPQYKSGHVGRDRGSLPY